MPRYVVERSFTDGLHIPNGRYRLQDLRRSFCANLDYGVTWVHSYLMPDKTKTSCVYDTPSPKAVRQSASANNLPVDRITEVSVLDLSFPPSAGSVPWTTPAPLAARCDAVTRAAALPLAVRRLSPRTVRGTSKIPLTVWGGTTEVTLSVSGLGPRPRSLEEC